MRSGLAKGYETDRLVSRTWKLAEAKGFSKWDKGGFWASSRLLKRKEI